MKGAEANLQILQSLVTSSDFALRPPFTCSSHINSNSSSNGSNITTIDSSSINGFMAPPTSGILTATCTATFLPQTALIPGDGYLLGLGLDCENLKLDHYELDSYTHSQQYSHSHLHSYKQPGRASSTAGMDSGSGMVPLATCSLPNIIDMHTLGAGSGGSGNSSDSCDLTMEQMDKARQRQIKAALRKERNKEAARRSNHNKKMIRHHLEQRSTELWEENIQLQQDIHDLHNRLRQFENMRKAMRHVCQHTSPSFSTMTSCR